MAISSQRHTAPAVAVGKFNPCRFLKWHGISVKNNTPCHKASCFGILAVTYRYLIASCRFNRYFIADKLPCRLPFTAADNIKAYFIRILRGRKGRRTVLITYNTVIRFFRVFLRFNKHIILTNQIGVFCVILSVFFDFRCRCKGYFAYSQRLPYRQQLNLVHTFRQIKQQNAVSIAGRIGKPNITPIQNLLHLGSELISVAVRRTFLFYVSPYTREA